MSGQVIARYYHGESGQYLEDWTEELSVAEVTFGEHGPLSARVEVPATAEFLHHSRCFPAGVGGFLEIDARSLGVPEVWAGRVKIPQFGGEAAGETFEVVGPEEWLGVIGVPLQGPYTAPSADIVRDALAGSAAQTWVEMSADSPTTYVQIPYEAGGETHWKLMTGLAKQRGEEFYLSAMAGRVGYQLRWSHPLQAPDYSDRLTLVQDENCRLESSAMNLGLPLQDAVGVALSFGAGSEVVGSLVKAPPAARARIGRLHGLTAALSTLTVRRLSGAGATSEAVPAPEVTSQAALDAMVESMVRRDMVMTATVQLADIDVELWPLLRAGALVGARLRDPHRLFANCLIRILTRTFGILPGLGNSISAELWTMEGA